MRRGLFQVKTPRSRSSALLCAVTRPDQRALLPPLAWLTDKISFRESSSRCAASGLRTATRVTAEEQELSSLWFSAGSGLSYTGGSVPEVETIERAREDAREGKSPSTQAGEFVREEMHHVRGGKHGARSTKQAIAIGLSKARRAGVKLAPPRCGQAAARTRKQATRDLARGKKRTRKRSRTRAQATRRALKR